MPSRTLVVVNPRSQSGATARRWERVRSRIEAALGPIEVEWTHGPRDAERIAREGVRAGVECLVVAGGDGTISEVVTGLLAAGLEGYARVAPLPLGTGGDLARTLGVPRDLDAALARIAAGKARPLDAGRVTFRGRDGGEARAYFVNVASVGISGLTTELVNRAPKAFGGRVSFLIGTLRSIVHYRSAPVRLRLDGRTIHDGRLILATAANGRFFGGGMQVAPGARPDDGLLDVVVIPHLSKPELLMSLPRIYRGTHLGVRGVVCLRGARLEADAEPGAVWLEVDGEPLGTLPAVFEVLPGAVSIIGSAA